MPTFTAAPLDGTNHAAMQEKTDKNDLETQNVSLEPHTENTDQKNANSSLSTHDTPMKTISSSHHKQLLKTSHFTKSKTIRQMSESLGAYKQGFVFNSVICILIVLLFLY